MRMKVRLEMNQKMNVCWGLAGPKVWKEPCQTTRAVSSSRTGANRYARRFLMRRALLLDYMGRTGGSGPDRVPAPVSCRAGGGGLGLGVGAAGQNAKFIGGVSDEAAVRGAALERIEVAEGLVQVVGDCINADLQLDQVGGGPGRAGGG